MLVAVAGGWFLSLGVRLIFPALLPYLRDAFGLGLSAAGLLVSALWVAYAVGQFPGGVLGDRLGEGNALVASTAVSAVAIALVAAANSVWTLFAGTVAFGLVTAVYGPARFTIISSIYDERDGTAIGLTLSAGEVGNVILPVTAGTLAAAVSWRLGFGFVVPLFVAWTVVLWAVAPGRPGSGEAAADSLSRETLRRFVEGVAERSILLVTGIHLLLFFSFQGFTGFYPTYLVEMKGLAPRTAAGLFGLFFAVGVVVQPLAGAGGDRFGARRALFVVIAITAVALAALPFAEGTVTLALVTVVASVMVGATPLTQTFLVHALPDDMKGSGLGLLRTGYIALGATGPFVVGVLADAGYFDAAFWLLAALAAVAFALCWTIPRRV